MSIPREKQSQKSKNGIVEQFIKAYVLGLSVHALVGNIGVKCEN